MPKRFRRRIQNFTCIHCQNQIISNGYTNHCPFCLWSLHVDVWPGDRNANCGGTMPPTEITQMRKGHILTHRCTVCGTKKRNRCSGDDDQASILTLYRWQAENKIGW